MEKPIFVALDLDSEDKLNQLLPKLGDPHKTYLKIGMEFFYNSGSQAVKKLVKQGYKIFLDLKLHDIPNTVYNGAKQLAQLGVYCVTVHALGGSQMIKAAKEGLIEGTPLNQSVPKLLAVTELTSISDTVLKYEQNCALTMTEEVISLAKTAKNAGADGVICSPLEVAQLRQKVGTDFLYVTPGIRPAGSAQDDQARTTTPKKAKELGASALVVGRPITLASNPEAAYKAIKKEFN